VCLRHLGTQSSTSSCLEEQQATAPLGQECMCLSTAPVESERNPLSLFTAALSLEDNVIIYISLFSSITFIRLQVVNINIGYIVMF